jgi:hypothetical protein
MPSDLTEAEPLHDLLVFGSNDGAEVEIGLVVLSSSPVFLCCSTHHDGFVLERLVEGGGNEQMALKAI